MPFIREKQAGFEKAVLLLTLYQPMTHIRVMSSHKPIRIYMIVVRTHDKQM